MAQYEIRDHPEGYSDVVALFENGEYLGHDYGVGMDRYGWSCNPTAIFSRITPWLLDQRSSTGVSISSLHRANREPITNDLKVYDTLRSSTEDSQILRFSTRFRNSVTFGVFRASPEDRWADATALIIRDPLAVLPGPQLEELLERTASDSVKAHASTLIAELIIRSQAIAAKDCEVIPFPNVT